MEKGKPDKTIDELDVYRSMRETQARMGGLHSGSERLERISSVSFLLRSLPEAEFESCMSAIEGMLQRINKSHLKKASQAKDKLESAKALNAAIGGSKLTK